MIKLPGSKPLAHPPVAEDERQLVGAGQADMEQSALLVLALATGHGGGGVDRRRQRHQASVHLGHEDPIELHPFHPVHGGQVELAVRGGTISLARL